MALRWFGDSAQRMEVYQFIPPGPAACDSDGTCSAATPSCKDDIDPDVVRGLERPRWPRRFWLNMKLHMMLMAVLSIAGALAGFWFGFAVMDRSAFWFLAGAVIGGHVPMFLFMFVIPARCPDCGQRLRMGITTRDDPSIAPTRQRSVYVPKYACGVCGYRYPAR